MASSSIVSTRSIAPAKTSTKTSTKTSAKPGLFAEMLRLWLEHNRRLAQIGIVPL